MSSSEIITNIDNSIYHLHLKPGQLSTDIILVGDPDRVDSITKYFDNIEFVIQNREFKSVTGSFNNKRISVISTGIGGSNIDIIILATKITETSPGIQQHVHMQVSLLRSTLCPTAQ